MRRLDDTPIDPGIAASLDAIDATLAGEPVDPRYAELAELALLLVDTRPEAEPAAVHALDRRVERRFAPDPRPARAKPRRARLWQAMGATAVGMAAVVGVVVALSSAPGGSSASSSSATVATESLKAPPAAASAGSTSARASAPTPTVASAGTAGSSSSTSANPRPPAPQ